MKCQLDPIVAFVFAVGVIVVAVAIILIVVVVWSSSMLTLDCSDFCNRS